MHAVVLHDDVAADGRADELDVFAQAAEVETALGHLGYTTSRLPLSLDLNAARNDLRSCRPDLVFNLVEAVAGQGQLIYLAPALLDTLKLPYTGAPTEALFLTTHKVLAKRALRWQALPTPDWVVRSGSDPAVELPPSRYIIKPVWEDASVGLDDDAVVQVPDPEALQVLLRSRGEQLGLDVFAERYVEGRELNLSLLAGPDGPEVLPPAEILFIDYAPGRPRLVGYQAKWDPDSFEYVHTQRTFELSPGDGPMLSELADLARRCWSVFGLRGYARVDFRVDADGRPWVLEVNANPCLSPDAGFLAAARQAGLTSTDVVRRIVADAVALACGTGFQPVAAPVENRCHTGPALSTQHSALVGAPLENRCRTGSEPLLEQAAGAMRLRDSVTTGDVEAIRAITQSTGFFAPHEIDIAVELVQERLARGPDSGYYFLFADLHDRTIGYACYGPIGCTVGSFDLYWIAVEAGLRGKGLGRRLLNEVERRVAQAGGRRLYIETSSRPDYDPTRKFYERCGYTEEARLQDFYAPGDAKVIFARVLTTHRPAG